MLSKNKNHVLKASSNEFLSKGLENLRLAMSDFSMEEFVIKSLEVVMDMDRRDYLNELHMSGCRDKGNGSYARSFKSLSRNSMIINIPRTRNSVYKPFALEFFKYQQEQINDLVLNLYKKGMTCRDTESILKDFFGENVSYAQVSKLAESFHELRLAWENSLLEKYYKVVFADAIFITLRRGSSYAKEPVHVIYGIREDNKRELLYLSINPSESSNSWSEAFLKLKDRGVEEIDLVVADGLQGLEGEIHKHFPGSSFQKCVVHKMRNVMTKVRSSHKPEIAKDIKHVFDNFDNSSTKEEAMKKLDSFTNKWKKIYPTIGNKFKEETIEYYFTYIDFPPNIRRFIYTTNSIESLNKKIRKATKNKQSFESPQRLLDYVFVVIKDFEASNWMKFPVSAFANWKRQTQFN